MRQYCVQHGWDIVEEYIDHKSGTGKVKPPAFDKMFQDAKLKRFDLVLVWSCDRWSRGGVLDTFESVKRLSDLNIGWKSFTEEYLDTIGVSRMQS